MRYLILPAFLLLGSCHLFSSIETTPAINNQIAQQQIVLDMFDSMQALVQQASMDEASRTTLLAKIAAERQKYEALASKMLEYLQSFGDVDWEQLAKSALELYKKVREEVK